MSENIGYHTRLYENSNVKVTGGSFGGRIDMETVNRLTRFFDVVVKPSGTPVFVDKEGREVWLYLTVDPRTTEKGQQALAAWSKERERLQREEAERIEQQESELSDLVAKLGHDEVLRRLKGETT